jgi:CheY-like chemotaxis protein
MNAVPLARRFLCVAMLLGPAAAMACGEMMFNAGKGLPFQTYLSPRPADVLILSDQSAAGREIAYGGLEQAGHRLTFVHDAGELKAAMATGRYDIVIVALESVDEVQPHVASRAGDGPRMLPVVARSARNSPQVKGRFEQVLLDGASVGQSLAVIERVLSASR